MGEKEVCNISEKRESSVIQREEWFTESHIWTDGEIFEKSKLFSIAAANYSKNTYQKC